LTAIKDNPRPVYGYGEYRYGWFGYFGSICWKIMDKLQLKWFDILIGIVQLKRYAMI